MNLNKKVQELTTQILEFKTQEWGSDRNIVKLKKKMERTFVW